MLGRRILFVVLAYNSLVFSQEEWSLQMCIDSAIAHNNGMRVADLNIAIAETRENGEKLNYLPTLNGNATHGYNWGQSIDPFTNQFANNRVQNNNFFLSSSVVLFSGLSSYYKREVASIDHMIAQTTSKVQKRDLVVEILSAFLQVKLNEAILALRKKHLVFTKEQLKKIRILEEMEYESSSKRLEIEAQLSQEEYQVILAENDLSKTIFLLQKLMGKNPEKNLALQDSFNLNTNLKVDETIINNFQAERQMFQNKLNKGQLLPRVSINGSLGSGYSGNSLQPGPNGELVVIPFPNQLENNFYQTLSASLSVPIFNGSNSYAQIKISELELERILFEKNQKALDINNRVSELSLDIENQRAALKAAKKSVESYQLLYDNGETEFNAEKISYYDFLLQKDALVKVESELLQARYKLVFAELILELYK